LRSLIKQIISCAINDYLLIYNIIIKLSTTKYNLILNIKNALTNVYIPWLLSHDVGHVFQDKSLEIFT
jgi:mRNA-degrading endonuclease HigB of HigAB toxin-antitoxin module